jgi:hypothetical protein
MSCNVRVFSYCLKKLWGVEELKNILCGVEADKIILNYYKK